jgi:hypothetical protein
MDGQLIARANPSTPATGLESPQDIVADSLAAKAGVSYPALDMLEKSPVELYNACATLELCRGLTRASQRINKEQKWTW